VVTVLSEHLPSENICVLTAVFEGWAEDAVSGQYVVWNITTPDLLGGGDHSNTSSHLISRAFIFTARSDGECGRGCGSSGRNRDGTVLLALGGSRCSALDTTHSAIPVGRKARCGG
jgi:hypothetical protein